MTEKYNGWTNRETWATMLHIDNDEVLLETALEYTREELEQQENDEPMHTYYVGEMIKSWIENDLLTRENIAGNEGLWLMLSDIGSLYRVNWREIAESLISNVKENA